MLARDRNSTELEDKILAAIITNTRFIQKIRKAYRPDYFANHGKIVSKWAIDYWDRFQEAPGKTIEDIYNVEKDKLKLPVAEAISAYLTRLSLLYGDGSLNLAYLEEKAFDFFRQQAYIQLITKGKALLRAGRVEDVVKLVDGFTKVKRETNRIRSLCDLNIAKSFLYDKEDKSDELFQFHGAFGTMIGPLKRGWLLAFLGPMKRGKSFWLQEVAFAAAISGKTVFYVNLEMSENDVRNRFYSRIVGTCFDSPDLVKFPIFDCRHNQLGTCPKRQLRTNDLVLRENGIDCSRPNWKTPGLGDYRVCAVCRDNPDLRKYYVADVWYTSYTPNLDFVRDLEKSLKRFKSQFGDTFFIKTFPPYSVTIEDIQMEIDGHEASCGEPPDIVIVDYADIIAPSIRSDSERAIINATWKTMKRSAETTHSLWVSASQTTRQALDKQFVTQKDIAEDIRKLAHVDVMLAINQTEEDKEAGFTRISCLAHRHKNISQLKQVAVLQQLEIGQTYLDSEFWQG